MGEAIAAVPHRDLAGRVAFTAGAVAVAIVAGHVPLPFLDPGAAALLGDPPSLRVFALWLYPFLSASVVVELVAAVVPRWARLRHGSAEGRGRLARAAWAVAALFAVFQSWGMVTYLGAVRGLRGELLLAPGAAPALAVGASLTAATLFLTWLAGRIDARGLCNGVAVLLAAQVVEAIARALLDPPRPGPLLGGVGPLAITIAAVALAAWSMRARPPDGQPRVPVPASGLVPLWIAASLLAFPATLASWFPALAPVAEALRAGSDAHLAVTLGLGAALTLVLVRLFCAPGMLRSTWDRADGGALDAERAAAVSDARSRALRSTLLLVCGLALVPRLVSAMGGVAPDVLQLVVLAAVVMDVIAEARARAGAELVPAHPLHRVFAVEPALAALRAAGIPAFARTRHFRALFHFFAPYAPIEILVPPERAAEADALCARVVVDPDNA